MRRVTPVVLGIVCAAIGATVASAALNERVPNQYDGIAQRNLFGLKENLIEIKSNPPPQLPKVYLSGITTVSVGKLAFLKLQGLSKQGAPATEESFMLTPGQKYGPIEVLEIDEVAGRVKINNSGTIMDLTFEKDAPKSNLPANIASQPPAMPNPSAGVQGQPMNANPALQNTATAPQAPLPATASYPLKRTLPTRNVPVAPPPLPPAPAGLPQGVQQGQMTPQEQQVLNELERANVKPY